jgi:membrane-bound lytic murein transglycosylase D
VADRFNVSVENLRRWNHLSSTAIKPRSSLYVSEPVHLAPASHARTKNSRGSSIQTKSATTSTTTKSAKPAHKTPAKTSAKSPTHSPAVKKPAAAKHVAASN